MSCHRLPSCIHVTDLIAATAAGGWEPDAGASTDDAWQPEAATANDEAFTGEFHEENISKHANGAADGGCRKYVTAFPPCLA